MGILDDVVVNAKSAAETVGKTASMLVDVSKLRLNLSELNGEISKRKQLLGEYVYDNCHDTNLGDVELAGKIAEIDELVERVQSINKMLLDKQNKAVCPVCGKMSMATAFFCSNCGAKLEKEEPVKKEPVQQQEPVDPAPSEQAPVQEQEAQTPPSEEPPAE